MLSTIVPAVGSLLGIGTIVLVYLLTWMAGDFPPHVITPPISLCGCQSPAHEAYQVGFTLTGMVLFYSIQLWKDEFYPQLEQWGKITGRATLYGGYMAVVGVIGQGVVTLERDLLEKFQKGIPQSQQSILHQQLAGVFFFGAAIHCYSTMFYCYKANKNLILYDSKSIRLKWLCVVVSLVSWPIADFLHPARTGSLNKRNFNVAGLAQYITVASYILFFGSYSLDFAYHRKLATKPEQQKISTTIKKQSSIKDA